MALLWPRLCLSLKPMTSVAEETSATSHPSLAHIEICKGKTNKSGLSLPSKLHDYIRVAYSLLFSM